LIGSFRIFFTRSSGADDLKSPRVRAANSIRGFRSIKRSWNEFASENPAFGAARQRQVSAEYGTGVAKSRTIPNPTRPETSMNAMPERPEGTVDPKLLEILVCPMTKGPLEYDATRQELVSRSAKLAYPIRDGIPIMLPEEARKID
jgi:uncharacterized protein YbaR (Trm112 family)